MVKTAVFFMFDQPLGALIHLNFSILISIYFSLMMPGVNYVIYGFFSARTNPGVSLLSLYRSLIL